MLRLRLGGEPDEARGGEEERSREAGNAGTRKVLSLLGINILDCASLKGGIYRLTGGV